MVHIIEALIAVLASHKQTICMMRDKALTGTQLDVDTEFNLQTDSQS